MTSKMRSLYLEGYDHTIFDLTMQDRVQIQVHGNSVAGAILHGNSPTEIIETFTESIGRPPELPHWIISGAVVGMQGGTGTVRNTWDILKTYDVPISSFWLQDWVGQRETLVGSQLWWNWEVDTTRYKGWQQLVKDLNNQHIKVMSYCNPCLAPTDEKPNRRRNMFEEAKKLDILVKDKDGEPYMVPNTAFDVGMLDLTHPETAPWFKNILQEMVDDGVRGWMADFGEGLPVDATLYSGEDPIAAHNRYPELWAQINREFVDEWKSSCSGKQKEDPEEALVFFMRAGFRDSPKWAMLFWEGDQMVSWQANDGIKSAVVGLLSSGISGYALNHSDIGGYCAVNLPLIKYHRSEELLFRWMEFSAFTTVFRTHEGNKPSCNSQFYSNHKTLSHFARLAKVYKAWKFYRIQLVKEASEKGLPVCRHLFLHYPEDEYVQTLTYQQFLVGSEILVAPVLDKGKREAKDDSLTCGGQVKAKGEVLKEFFKARSKTLDVAYGEVHPRQARDTNGPGVVSNVVIEDDIDCTSGPKRRRGASSSKLPRQGIEFTDVIESRSGVTVVSEGVKPTEGKIEVGFVDLPFVGNVDNCRRFLSVGSLSLLRNMISLVRLTLANTLWFQVKSFDAASDYNIVMLPSLSAFIGNPRCPVLVVVSKVHLSDRRSSSCAPVMHRICIALKTIAGSEMMLLSADSITKDINLV
uniref:Alpha-glucosidase n=1 Tax=Chenopodium quinoa TaxID=63459 RepID=A0A803MJ63_CHEQI